MRAAIRCRCGHVVNAHSHFLTITKSGLTGRSDEGRRVTLFVGGVAVFVIGYVYFVSEPAVQVLGLIGALSGALWYVICRDQSR